jgi:hypothetical protein
LLEHCPTAALNTVESIRIDPDGVVVGRADFIEMSETEAQAEV